MANDLEDEAENGNDNGNTLGVAGTVWQTAGSIGLKPARPEQVDSRIRATDSKMKLSINGYDSFYDLMETMRANGTFSLDKENDYHLTPRAEKLVRKTAYVLEHGPWYVRAKESVLSYLRKK